MKFSVASVAAFSMAMSVVSAFSIPEIPLLQQNPLGGLDQVQDAISMSPATVSALKDIASSAGERIQDVSAEILHSWAQIEHEFPGGLKRYLQTTAQQDTRFEPKKLAANRNTKWIAKHTMESAPSHVLRVADPSSLGLDDVQQYSGYVDIEEEDKHFFYWFFESRNDPKNDPVLLWLNGGPGCSSMTGQFFELGPSSINEDLTLTWNPSSWNQNASVIFLDQPVNVGFSYSSNRVKNSRAAAEDVHKFLSLFFDKFPKYAKQDFHIAGESYAGHYIPAIATEIQSHSDKNYNLTSILIGNGITDERTQVEYYRPMACGEGGYPAVITPEECDKMERDVPKCQRLVDLCYSTNNRIACVAPNFYCNAVTMGAYQQTGRNVYDIREQCGDSDLCYEQEDWITAYLNQPHVLEAIGAEVEVFEGCKNDVGIDFVFDGDHNRPFHYDIADLLDDGLPVLIYAGDKDFICNWLGNQAWTDTLDWTDAESFFLAETRNWTAQVPTKHGKTKAVHAGTVKNAGKLTYLRVFDAGHMVPFNQPETSLDMVNRWIAGDYAFKG
ncbi:Alpha/Beta hydrolase protein [Yarrowia lipolytica]|uniref:Carboxypeptidase n=1 Tax=Yarrowia lipolytica TaxID=4952 RepID=A0A371C6I2_YARLL|nr:Alpha/Beta hydrolase protein [Yarrowia lipolytica]RDW32708.1 Alpha/Beta hydrolase protein [Yarrowia lipolytica]RDW38027.1 Alpha/Beta hydrolase protein [Yarrowia lipolytica]RDW45546.1 Alpha/Beta hydrolase protein [Yarrowia lipolytica]RDW52181.1 Alpha/Beta hydrolase protein [Yarrowia lipolytica]